MQKHNIIFLWLILIILYNNTKIISRNDCLIIWIFQWPLNNFTLTFNRQLPLRFRERASSEQPKQPIASLDTIFVTSDWLGEWMDEFSAIQNATHNKRCVSKTFTGPILLIGLTYQTFWVECPPTVSAWFQASPIPTTGKCCQEMNWTVCILG